MKVSAALEQNTLGATSRSALLETKNDRRFEAERPAETHRSKFEAERLLSVRK